MAERYEAFRRFDYRLNSNLVIQKETHAPNQNEPTGEPESLVGRLKHPMGDKVVRATAQELKEALQRKRSAAVAEADRQRSGPLSSSRAATAKRFKGRLTKGSSVLDADISETSSYRPTTRESATLYEQLLSEVTSLLGDQPADVLAGAAEELILICRDGEIRENEKRDACSDILGQPISPEAFIKVFNLSRGLHDFTKPSQGSDAFLGVTGDGTADGTDGPALSSEVTGVAVVFDEDDDDAEPADAVGEEEAEADDDEDDDEDTGPEARGGRHRRLGDETEEKYLEARYTSDLDSDDEEEGLRPEVESDLVLNVRTIDPHWLQRELGKLFPDAELAVALEKQILEALTLPDLQQCENKLVYILKYDNFSFAKKILNNRWKVYYCTRLGQSQSQEEKNRILEDMRATPHGQEVLDQLETVKLRVNKEKEFARNVRREAATLAGRAAETVDQDRLTSGSRSRRARQAPQDRSDDEGDTPMRDGLSSSAREGPAGGALSGSTLKPTTFLDLESLAFQEGGRLMANTVVKLHEDSQRIEKKAYDEVVVPPPPPMAAGEGVAEQLEIEKALPEWAQEPFHSAGIRTLNRIQSAVFPVAWNEQERNLLICAPTGAGKTNIAVLSILCLLRQHRNPETGLIDTRGFKAVYISPMKALVAEQVASLQKRFACFGLRVEELTGDTTLSRQQLEATQILVTTPEKWDVITRKSGDERTQLRVKLLIIDEIHLLHDARGPVLEAIVARTLRQIEATQQHVRLVGLSATLPNYQDVAIFLRVSLTPNEGLFVFGPQYRPVPLQQTYIGLKEKKAVKRLATMNRVTYEKALENAGRNQVLIFVHSRRETVRTARLLRQMATDEETLPRFLAEDSASREILRSEAEALKTPELRDLLPFGFAVHHAGLPRTDRRLVEDLFADRHIQVLVSTATLAWGVNLPAHTVIIKGTQVYMPEKGCWTELSPLDVMQMMGRAGRPQYDSAGHGIILTTHSELQFYLSLNNQQLPVESQLMSALPDILNAEITLGTISNRDDAVRWLGYTYLFVRLLRNPTLYGFPPRSATDQDVLLSQLRTDLVHSAFLLLDKHQLIRYDKRLGSIQPTPLGRVASHYYLRYPSVAVYNEHLRPSFSDIELLRLFSLSQEFRYIPVRQEEKVELARLMERVPIPVKGAAAAPGVAGGGAAAVEDTSTKVNVLLQAYISQLRLEGFALAADMTYVQQSAGRIMRALFEIALNRGWSQLALRALLFCKMIQKRMWAIMSPLRQFRGLLTEDVLRKLEKKDFPWERYFNLSSAELGELIRAPKLGKLLHRLIHAIPKVVISAFVQPLTRSTLLIEVSLTPDFRWDAKLHDAAGEGFWVFVEDGDQETILHHEFVVLKEQQVNASQSTGAPGFELLLSFAVPITEPLPPNYFLRCVSDRWLQSETLLPISFKNLILPDRNPPHTELLDLQPLPVMALRFPEAEPLYLAESQCFDPIETQVFAALYNDSSNVLLCAPPSPTGLRTSAEFAILRMLKTEAIKRCVYIVPYEACARRRYLEWEKRLGRALNLTVSLLTGDVTTDLKRITASNIIISTPEHWDYVSRRWRTRRVLQQIRLLIVDALELINSEVGATLEVCVSRMRYISAQLPHPIRIVGLSFSLSNANDVAEWLGVPQAGLFNFPNTRPNVKIVVEPYDAYNRTSRLLSMVRPTFQWIKRCCPGNRQAIIFCPDRKQARVATVDLLLQAAPDDTPDLFSQAPEAEIAPVVKDLPEKALQHALVHGIGYLHEGLSTEAIQTVTQLYEKGAIKVLCVTHALAWSLDVTAHLVVIQETTRYDVKQKRWESCPVVDVLRMSSRAQPSKARSSATVVVMCPAPKKELYLKFKSDPIPVESCLDQSLADHLNAEVTLKTIESKQDAVDWLTWSLYYRRLSRNPNYYGLQGVTHNHLSEHLSEIVETAVEALESGQCLAVDAEDGTSLTELNLGLVAAFYYIRHTTVELLNRSTNPNIKRKGLLEVICAASEFADVVPLRFGEESVLTQLAAELGIRLGANADVNDPHIKALLLLYAHFHRTTLTTDLASDQVAVIAQSLRLIHALVDVLSSNGWLAPALIAMELSQMVVQALHPSKSVLLQLPYFDAARVALAKEKGILDMFDVMNAEDADRDAILQGLKTHEIEKVAAACNRYPVMNVEFEIPGAMKLSGSKPKEDHSEDTTMVKSNVAENDTIMKPDPSKNEEKVELEHHDAATPESSHRYRLRCGTQTTLVVHLERVADSEDLGPVIAPYYPKEKEEQWWLVLGHSAANSLLAIKRITANKLKSTVKLEFDVPQEAGPYPLTVSLMCDSYLGCDQEYEILINAE